VAGTANFESESVPAAHGKQFVSVRKNNLVMLYRETMAFIVKSYQIHEYNL
jgi:hypothetical protein